MVLACFSADPELSDVCRDSLNALGLDVDVSQSHSVDTFSDGDIEIVEFQSLRLPLSSKAARKWKPRIYLIDREDIDDFLLKVRPPYCAILKPVNEHSLAMALRDAMELASISAGGDPRSETDGLLRLSARAQLLLQVADQDRMRFLGRVAHDLKGPITALSGYCDLLIDDELGRLQPQQSSTVARMQKTVDRLSRMAADILELSVNAEIDRPRPLQLGDIGKVIGHAVREFMPVASAKRLRMVTRVENCPAPIAFDTAGLESVVANLLENAYRFTPAAGLIEVSAYPATRRQKRDWSQASGDAGSAPPDCYRVDVHNTGPGILEKHIAHIFARYATYGESIDRHSAGLGLAICRIIVNRHQGSIWAENKLDGPSFSFVIPFSNQAAQLTRTNAI